MIATPRVFTGGMDICPRSDRLYADRTLRNFSAAMPGAGQMPVQRAAVQDTEVQGPDAAI